MAVGVPNPFTAQSCASGLIRSRCGQVFHSATSTGGGGGVRKPMSARTYLLMNAAATRGYHRPMSPELDVGGRKLAVKNLDRVVFPRAGVTKGAVLDYYARVGEVMLPHLRERLLHMHRYPEGVEGPRFWQKGCPEHRPEWMPTAPVWSRDKGENIDYCVVNELAALRWAVNIGSIELHTSLHRREELHRPTALAFDLDPGEGVGILECGEVALRLRELFAEMGRTALVKTSGSKGLQVYVPVEDGQPTYAETKPTSK